MYHIRKSVIGLNLFCKVGRTYLQEVGSTKILALVLMTLLLVVGISDGSSDSRKVIQASEILAAIERGDSIKYDDVVVEGNLELSGLEMPSEHVGRTEFEIEVEDLKEEARIVNSSISITNSEIRGDVILSYAIFRKSVDFRGTNFSGDTHFNGAKSLTQDKMLRFRYGLSRNDHHKPIYSLKPNFNN
jgi:hypothetical protein